MIELKKEGLYIANGSDISVLIKVVGEAPMLDIPCGVLLNDMQNKGVVTVLDKNSPEIQDILSNPSSYVYDYPSVSEAVNNIEGLNKQRIKQIEYDEKKFNKWIDKYNCFRREYPDNYDSKMIIFLWRTERYSITQAQMVIKQINSRIKLRNLGI